MSGFKTPSFWYREPGSATGLTEYALFPFSILYGAGQKMRRQLSISERVSCPVVCVGNIVAGGSGKTPSVAALWTLILESGIAETPWILTRGYGGTLSGPVLVDPTKHRADQVGDEPLMLAARGMRVVVCTDRVEGAWFAIKSGADLILMDDGFQNPRLHKDFSLLVIDGVSGLGNRSLLPAGPLREKPEDAFARAQAVILIGEDRTGVRSLLPPALPVFSAHIEPQKQPDQSGSYIGFAGLGRPEKFRSTLKSLGLELKSFHGFADHHAYSADDFKMLFEEAENSSATLITTEKDFMRLSSDMRMNVDFLPIELVFDDSAGLAALMRKGLVEAKTGGEGK